MSWLSDLLRAVGLKRRRPRPAPAVVPPPYRTILGCGSHGDGALDRQACIELLSLGVRHVRVTLYTTKWNDEPGYRERWLREVREASDKSFRVLAVAHHHQGTEVLDDKGRNAAIFLFQSALFQAATEAGDAVEAWQLWNEPDHKGFTDAFGANSEWPHIQSGTAYGGHLAAVVPGLRRIAPHARIVSAGLAQGGIALSEFLRGMLYSRADFDVLALHCYGLPVLVNTVEKFHIAKVRYPGRPLWITEFGMDQAVIPSDWAERGNQTAVDSYQRDNMVAPVQWNDDRRAFARMYWHTLRQGGDLGYSLIRDDGSLRPAAEWMRDYNKGAA